MTPPKSLVCRKCSRGYISKDQFKKRGPVLLDCGHSVCEECIRGATGKDSALPCPQCHQVTHVQNNEQLPDAYINGCLVLNVKQRMNEESLSFVSQKKGKRTIVERVLRPVVPDKEKCDECAINYGSLLCSKCEDCRFCEGCFNKIHRTSRLLARHVPLPAVSATSDDGGATAERCCPLHPARPLEYYCSDDDVAVCSHCSISGEHKGHAVEPISDRNKRRRPELEQAAERARTTLARLRLAAKGLRAAPAVDSLEPAALLETIQEHFSQLHGRLQLRQQQLSAQLLEAAESQRAHVRRVETTVEESCDSARRVLTEAEAVLAGVDATLDVQPLLQKLWDAADRPCHLIWTDAQHHTCQIRFLADKELLPSIGEHGSLTVDVPPPVQLMAESELPLDHVVKDITPEMLEEGHSAPDQTTASSGAGSRSTSEEVVGVAIRAPARLLSSPRVPDRRLAAVFPCRPAEAAVTTGGATVAAAPTPPAPLDEAPLVSFPQPPVPLGPFGQEVVVVTHIRSPVHFYVQRSSQERQLKELMRRVDQWCRNPDSRSNKHRLTLAKNELCLSQYKRDKLWYRARITDVYPPSEERSPCEYEVFYVDYGNQERVVEPCLLPMTTALARDPEVAVRCALWDLLPVDGGSVWGPQATHAFADLVRGEPVVMTTIRDRGQHRDVELLKPPNKRIATDTQQSVRDHLVFLQLAIYCGATPKTSAARPVPPTATPVTITRVEGATADLRHFYACEQLARGSQTDVLVSHVDSPDLFYIQQLGVHAKYLTSMMDEMQQVYSTGKSTNHALLNPRQGQVCVARFTQDGLFYRAVIELLLPHALVDVCYVDYGNRERLSLQAVRKIEDRFMVIPMQAIRCRLADIQPHDTKAGWEDIVRRHLIEATDNKPLKMYVDEVSAEGYTVTLYQCRRDADVCVNALLARLECVHGSAPSLRVVEYTKVGWEPARDVRSTASSAASSSAAAFCAKASTASFTSPPRQTPDDNRTTGQSAPPSMSAGPPEVVVSHCQSPALLCVQLTDEIATLQQMMKEMQMVYGAGGISTHNYVWKPDDVAVARCPPSSLFCRIRVQSVCDADPDKVQVCLIDYGKTETVAQKDIAVMMKDFEAHRAFAMTCHLDGIRPAGDRGKWAGCAIDFLKNMLDATKKLFLINKWTPVDGEDSITSLPCDLEAEEERNVGALEPIRRIRTSLSGKLVERGLAFSNGRSVGPVVCEPDALSAGPRLPATLHQLSTVTGTQPPADVGSPLDTDESQTLCPDPDTTPPGSVARAASDRESITPPGSPASPASDRQSDDGLDPADDIPLGADWATISGRQRASASAAAGTEADLEQSMLEAEKAAEAVEEQPPDDDWLPARVPAAVRFRAQPTHVTMAGSIFVHTFPKGKETLDIIKQALNSKYKGSQPRPCDSYWFEGQPCIAKYYLDECWYRAKVLQVHSEKVSVQFIDYGNTDRIEPSELRKNIFMEHVPVQALHCELHNIVPLAEDGQFPMKTLNFLHSQIVERECQVEVHHFNATRRRFMISLQLVQSGIDVNELLVKMGDARYMTEDELAAVTGGVEPLLDSLLLRVPYPQLRLPAGGPPIPVTCVIVVTPALLLVQPKRIAGEPAPPLRRLRAHLEAIEAIRDTLDEEAARQPPLQNLAVGAPCLSQFSEDNAWYRAVVLAIEGDNIRVQYVDWGNMEEVKAASLREVPAHMLEVPAWVMLVELYRVAPADASGWKPETTSAMVSCLFNQNVQLWARVKQSQREPPLVELVVFEQDESSPMPKAQLAYQKAIDDGLLVVCAAERRQ